MKVALPRCTQWISVTIPSLVLITWSATDVNAQAISDHGLETVFVQTNAQDVDSVAESSNPDSSANPSELQEPGRDDGAEPASPSTEPVAPATAPPPATARTQAASSSQSVQEKRAAAMAKMKGAYAGVFYANNFSYLDDPYYNGPRYFSDCFKNIQTRYGTLSLGGESRYRYHDERNMRGLGITGNDDTFWLTRNRLYADWHINDTFRIYAEALDANSGGEIYAPRPIEENDFDIQNLFVDVKLLDGPDGTLTARLGRQELLFGAQRTVSPLDWANTRRTFQGVRGNYQQGDTSIDAFWTELVRVDPKGSDDVSSDIQFYGTYLTQQNTSLGTLESYYLGSDNHFIGFSEQTLGSRVSGATDNGTLYDFEGAYQFGSDATDDRHSAGFFSAGLGRNIETDFFSPVVWCRWDRASGEKDFNEVGQGDGGYDHLYPLAHKYLGFMDLFGRRNLDDFNVFTQTPLTEKVSLILWYHYFRLVEATTPYSVVMTPYNTTTPAASKDLGHEIDVLLNYNINPRNNVVLGYSHFNAGDYYDAPTIGPADGKNDADFFYFQYTTRY
ncbi:alginate export family protein [Allorhodopirellula solitaria]|uniref:Alginate export domain-containing protein n=1 Tax=Allorhodopirellula solitaria TaxID=2527987 RepID=A0A5C5YGV2_9BACT|nr:alginate export family protein [Allorhodopirellula solitaria]TWT74203.1 hypothetical protein CA85_10900 [Allorhodopirellula solitaria]